MTPKISIIIPVYNAEKYLRECLDSVLKQSFTDFEVLLINDGSKDNSGKICEEYGTKDNRIKVFHKENGGVSSARNLGIEIAKGDWITFVDSDDYIAQNYFSSLHQLKQSVDLILIGLSRFGHKICTVLLKFENNLYRREDLLDKLPLYPNFPGPCGKFFKASIIKSNGLVFNPEMSFGEDVLFNIRYLYYCRTIYTNNTSTYYYRDTPNSLSKINFNYGKDLALYSDVKKSLTHILSDEKVGENNNILAKNLIYLFSRVLASIYKGENTSTYKAMKYFLLQNRSIALYAYGRSKKAGRIKKFFLQNELFFLLDRFYKVIYKIY